jgi:prepilin-type processing-associated H-X9-DG protein
MVAAIIAALVGLILPGLLSGREAARRIQCTNNLRQIALGLQNYLTVLEVLPPGVVNPTGPIHNTPDPDDIHVAWTVLLLPYVELRGVAEATDYEVSVYDAANDTVRNVQLNVLLCPAAPGKSPDRFSSYAACHHDVEAPIDVDNHGVFYLNSAVRECDITDGCSATIFVGEKSIDRATDLGWLSGTSATLRNTGTPINAPPGSAGGGDRVGGFASRHPGGANFAFGDGSVRFVAESISPAVYRLLGHRADGEMVGDDEY